MEVVVAAIRWIFPVACLFMAFGASAKILPADRADVLWHYYDGGGVTVQGPSVLVRKAYKNKLSLWGHYYMDMVSGASIDVRATASKYAETRKEGSLGVDYLYNKTLMGFGFIQSDESDYTADTVRFDISQDFFGDLTTLSMGYSYGSDRVGRNHDPGFEAHARHQTYQVGLSQIVNKHMVMDLNYEADVDEGYLNNPYRSVRFIDPSAAKGYSYQPEQYPLTHSSDAIALSGMYYLPYRAALRGEYRYYSDTWGVAGSTLQVSYTQPWRLFQFDAKVRYYTQGSADFYSDLFPYRDAQNFLARDKELSSFSSTSVGLGVGYDFSPDGFWIFRRGQANVHADYMMFHYDNFRNVTVGAPVGEEPLYQFNALVLRVFISLWL